jgi:hypothetical protein
MIVYAIQDEDGKLVDLFIPVEDAYAELHRIREADEVEGDARTLRVVSWIAHE